MNDPPHRQASQPTDEAKDDPHKPLTYLEEIVQELETYQFPNLLETTIQIALNLEEIKTELAEVLETQQAPVLRDNLAKFAQTMISLTKGESARFRVICRTRHVRVSASLVGDSVDNPKSSMFCFYSA